MYDTKHSRKFENAQIRISFFSKSKKLKHTLSKNNFSYNCFQVSISSPNDPRSYNVDDFTELEETIQKCQETVMSVETVRIFAGSGDAEDSEDRNRISETAIYVQIVKQGIPDVTLIDLPGINYTNETIKSR